MSRGFGIRQRQILAELARQECFWLRTLLPRDCTRAEYNALNRAAQKLEDAGLVVMDRWRYHLEGDNGIGRIAVRRVGTSEPERAAVPTAGPVRWWPWDPSRKPERISVGKGENYPLANTYKESEQ